MAAAYALSALFSAGLSARIEGDQLRVQPAERLTDALRNLIRKHKSELMDALRGEAANGPQTYRRWSIRTPDGKTWDVTRTPLATAAELAATWPPGSTVTPVPDQPRPTDSPALDGDVEARIRAWLAHIGEQDQAHIGEVLDRCRHEPDVLRFYLDQAQNMPGANPGAPTSCGPCARYQRTTHPHLVHCQAGEPEPAGGLWDTTPRSCDQWEAKP